MEFNTLPFAAFFAAVLALWTLLRGRPRWRFGLLLASSAVFYAHTYKYAWSMAYAVLLGVALFDWGVGLALSREERPGARRAWMALAVVVNLGVLGYSKYTNFALELLRPVAGSLHLRWPEPIALVLPLGISFFTFQGLGYAVDVYRRDKPVVGPFQHLLLALGFFPHLPSGPIVRPFELIPQLLSPAPLDPERFGRALYLFLKGLLKKAAADYIAHALVERVFDLPSHYSTVETLAAIYGYSLQIYGDFSGYTDMALGVAALLGIDLPQNFDHPYASTSLRDFWRRWHISLSSWLRDYLYIGLGGSRRGFWRTQLNLFATMVLGGLWHGASLNFVIWGALHGGLLVVDRLFRTYVPAMKQPGGPVRVALGTIFTFHAVTLAWIFFRAETFDGALAVIHQVARGWGGGWANLSLPGLAVLGAGVALHFAPERLRALAERGLIASPVLVQGCAAMACLYAARSLTGDSAQPFIYFQF